MINYYYFFEINPLMKKLICPSAVGCAGEVGKDDGCLFATSPRRIDEKFGTSLDTLDRWRIGGMHRFRNP